MTRWKKDETDFQVSVNRNKDRGFQATIPKPIADLLGITEEVGVRFLVVNGKKVELKAGKANRP